MPRNFLSLPEKIRNEIYKYLVVQNEPICFKLNSVWDSQQEVYPFKVRQGELEINTNILRVNKLIHREASILLYSRNCFYFTNEPRYGSHFEKFFNRIGMYANCIQHIKVHFPVFVEKTHGRPVIFRHNSGPMFDQIQSHCINLQTIELAVDKNKRHPPGLESQDCSEFVTEGLALINNRLREFPSLQNILVVTDFLMGRGVQMEMGNLGWEIKNLVNRNVTSDIQSTNGYITLLN